MSATATQPQTAATGYEPKIVAFVCKWCTYAGADLAGTSRMVYPPNVRTLMLPCTGRIDVSFVLRAFLQGADGVIVSGCHPGDCHYTAGNYRARRRWTLFRDLLETLGIDLRRFDLAWISAAEGAKWVKTIEAFTAKIRGLGAYTGMHEVASSRIPPIASPPTSPSIAAPKVPASKSDPKLVKAITEALESNKVKAVLGWTTSRTLNRAKPAWITSAAAAAEMVLPGDSANIARLFKQPNLRKITPVGIVARSSEIASINVLAQESQVDPSQIHVFMIDATGSFVGEMPFDSAAADMLKALPAGRVNGFSEETLKILDDLMAKPADERWKYWADQFSKCVKCYACRESCPMCNCEQCFVEKNQPQWFPTASDGPGNVGWHVIRGFHMAGRCVGCGACQDACPAGIPLNAIGASMARSALKNFDHRAGTDATSVPVQSSYRPDDKEDFIL